MILLCCGDRNWKDRELIAQEIYKACRDVPESEPIRIVEGEADGADKMCRQYALKVGIFVVGVHADWQTHGKAAGMIRNQRMLDEHHPDLVLAFHDDIEHSKGTGDMVRRARLAGIPVIVVKHQLPPE